MRQVWIADKLREYSLQVVEHNGWQTRGSDTFNPRGVVCHHTASNRNSGDASALNMCINGRSDLPGPLAHIVLSRSGVAHVIAAGRANHAGSGSWNGLTGNSSVFGIEAENDGIGEPWPDAQLKAYVAIVAALANGAGFGVENVCGHKEWAPTRKPDPRGIEMSWFRDQIRGYVKGGVSTPPAQTPPPRTPPQMSGTIFKRGSTGPGVVTIQNNCNFWGWNAGNADGGFGPATEAAVIRAQYALRINPDGIWGPATQKAYDDFVEAMKHLPPKPEPVSRPTLRKGDKGEWVKKAQKALGYLTVDGDFGQNTYLRTIKVQRLKGLNADGIIGPQTWEAIL